MTDPSAAPATEADRPAPNFPMRRGGCPFDPPPEYARMRGEGPVARAMLGDGQPVWLVTRHADVRAVLTDPRISGDLREPGMPVPGGGNRSPAGVPYPRTEAPDHSFWRRLLLPRFTVRQARRLRPRFQQLVDDTLDAMARLPQPADLVEAFALPIPSLVICDILGVPYEDHAFFQAKARVMMDRHSTPEQLHDTVAAIRAYMTELFELKRAHPADDLLTTLVQAQAEYDIGDDDLARVAQAVLNAGHETTANMIALSVLLLLDNPGTLAELRADAGLWPDAVEEMLRYLSIGDLVSPRTTTGDIPIGDTMMRAGDGLFALIASANRDAAAFPDPDTFDIRRGARHHVAFGYGVHQCLGQNIARIELPIVFETLFRRFPDLRVDKPLAELPYKHDAAIFGLHEIPVRW
jgi:pentalenic acid synthase